MQGHKRERAPGKWQLVAYVGRDPVTDKPRYRYRTFHGKSRAADTALAAFITETTKERPATTQTVGWLLDEYLRLLALENRAETTLRTYTGYIETWLRPTFGDTTIKELTAGQVRQLAAKMTKADKSPSTIRQVHAILRGALKFAMQHDWVERNVATLATPPKLSPTSVVAATPDEADRLYRASGVQGSDLSTAIALATHTGARLGELCALKWSDIDGEVIHFTSTKTHQTGDVPITETLRNRLAERLAFQLARAEKVGTELVGDPYVLSHWADGSKKPRSDGYGHSFAGVRDALGLGHLHFHTLRHAFATQALAAGVDPVTVAKLLRHRDLSMIGRVYGHGTPEATREAALKIDAAFRPTPLLPKGEHD